MKKYLPLLLAPVLMGIASNSAHAQFTPGNVVVLQVGDGTAALSNASTALFLKEYNTTSANQATSVTSVALPITGAARLTESGSATSEGQITLSSDSFRIVVSGYDTTVGTASIASTASASYARAIDTVNGSGIAGRAASTATQFTGNNIRCSAMGAGNNYWSVGGNSGTYYMGNSAAAAAIQTTTTNIRVINTFNGNLYYSSGSGTSSVFKLTGMPTTTAVPTTVFATGTGSSPYGFAVNAAETVVYVADDRTAAGGGIQKWVYASSSWGTTPAYILNVGTSIGARSVTVDFSGTYPVLYAITTDNKLVRLVDSNQVNLSFVTLATAATNTAFRSVVFSPRIPCTPPVATVTPVTSTTFCAGDSVVLNATTGSGYTYQWKQGTTTLTGATNSSYKAGAAGSYSVTITSGQCSTTSSGTTVTVNAKPTLSTVVTNITCTATGAVALTATGGATPYTYQWSGPASFGATTQNITGLTTAGAYKVIVTTAQSCKDSITSTVTSTATLTASATPVGPIALCTGDSTLLSANTGTGYTYTWNQNSSPIPGATNATFKAGAAGQYTVTVTNSSCSNTSNAVVITLLPVPAATITPSGTVGLCTGFTLPLQASTGTGNTYLWYVNNIAVPTATGNPYIVTAPGLYKVKITNTAGCSATSANDTVVAAPMPVTTLTITGDTTFCQGNSVVITAASGNTYDWRNNAVSISGATSAAYTANAAGLYSVKITTALGCMDSSRSVTVVVNPLPTPSITNAGFVLSTGSFTTYQWSLNGTPISGATNQSYTATQDGNYTVTVTDSHGCANTSASQNVTGTDVADVTANAYHVHIFPNPAHDVVNIAADITVNATIKDMQGRTIVTAKNTKSINISALAAGVYFVEIRKQDNELLRTEKLVKAAN